MLKIIKKEKKRFTIIELLIVIGIIALLSALMFPVMSLVRNRARGLKAKSMANSVCAAVGQYELDYGIIPAKVGNSDLTIHSDDKAYDTLIAILSQQDYAGHSYKNKGNARRTTYLNVPSNYEHDGYVDPWGKRFVIILDTNYDGKVEVGVGSKKKTLYGKVFVYSFGTNQEDDHGSPEDDVVSWK